MIKIIRCSPLFGQAKPVASELVFAQVPCETYITAYLIEMSRLKVDAAVDADTVEIVQMHSDGSLNEDLVFQ